tara:strand:- start:357 stop:1022 length:666 start_codon:yes stop_codon:yes gene_type:complete
MVLICGAAEMESNGTGIRIGQIIFGVFLFFFGLPFTLVPFMILGPVSLGIDNLFESLFLIGFSIPFLLAGLGVQFLGLSAIFGWIKSEVEPDAKSITEHPDKIQFPNPLKIEVDGKVTEFQLDNQKELSYEAIRGILASDEFWIIHLDPNRDAFIQMHIDDGQFEYWTDGAMRHQQTGDIDDALKYLESIASREGYEKYLESIRGKPRPAAKVIQEKEWWK